MATQKVTDKIHEDAKKEAQKILNKYKDEAAKIKAEYSEKINAKKAQIKAEVEVFKKTEILRMISQKRLEFNRKIVTRKRTFIKDVIKETLEKLSEHKDYLKFLEMLIKKSGESEGELVINKRDWKQHGPDLEKFMKSEGLSYRINHTDDIMGGLTIKKDKILYHGSLDLISELLSDELTIAVSKTMY